METVFRVYLGEKEIHGAAITVLDPWTHKVLASGSSMWTWPHGAFRGYYCAIATAVVENVKYRTLGTFFEAGRKTVTMRLRRLPGIVDSQ